jgi:hypothetical protein
MLKRGRFCQTALQNGLSFHSDQESAVLIPADLSADWKRFYENRRRLFAGA